jgi:glutaminase
VSQEFGLHLLRPPISPASVVFMSRSLAEVSSQRRRTASEMRCLAERGGEVRVCRLQGPLAFSTAEVALRSAMESLGECSTIVLDWHRVAAADEAACRLFGHWARGFMSAGGTILFAGLREGEEWERMILEAAHVGSAGDRLRVLPTLDQALEWCEDMLLASAGELGPVHAELPLTEHPMLATLTPAEVEAMRPFLRSCQYAPGQSIVRQGDDADAMYLVGAGTVTVNLRLPDGRRHRITTMGPGSTFGEFALLEQEPRTADVDAESAVLCYVLQAQDMPQVEQAAPGVTRKLIETVARDLAARLRRADREIAALVS